MKTITIELPADFGLFPPTSAEILEALDWYREYKEYAAKNQDLAPAREILDFLNRKAKKNFKPVKANLDAIQARLKEGATVQDLKAVVAMKCRKWIDNKEMCEFLRPATLFGRTKFWQYHGELTQGGANANPMP